MDTVDELTQKQAVRKRYARAAAEESGCCDTSCCGDTKGTAANISEAIGYSAEELSAIPEGANLGLGCGNPTALASLEEGQTVLDLGSGAGIDCFLAAKAVGPTGHVIGVDMTHEMLERARQNAKDGGYDNVEFRLGEIEALPVADGTVDVIISNCVVNLSTDKDRVLAEAYRVLKPGGRMVISDMVSDVPVPEELRGDLDAVAGCLPTLRETYLERFRAAGFSDVRVTEETPYPTSFILEDEGVAAAVANTSLRDPDALKRFAESISGAHFEAHKS
jgi:ubiquinone/menaquinone biosynthesis C-methylase UbiE